MNTIEVKCEYCGKPVQKLTKEINRCRKKGMKSFCNTSCSAKHRNNLMTDEYWKKQYQKQKKTFDIKSQCGNQRDEYSRFKYFVTKGKSRTKISGYDFDITTTYLKTLWEKQNGVCPYTGIKMILPDTTNLYQKIHSMKKASIDRIDSSKGYIEENVEFVCLGVNLAKSDYTKNEATSFFKEIASSQNTLSITQAKPS